ncbi:MAG: hypothetical protein LKE31_01350 [Bacilli bacterium]|jgi:hypothetical protein|nr:hypothetical protein [Bacilli bacterium]
MRKSLFLILTLLSLSSCTFALPNTSNGSTHSSVLIEEDSGPTLNSFDYGADYIAAHLPLSYWITYSYSAKTNGVAEEPILITSARNEQGYYIKDNSGTEALFLKDGTSYLVYMPNDAGELALVPDLRLDEENVKGYSTSFLGFMGIYDVAKDELVPDGEETVAGRACYKYVFHASYVASAIDLYYSIDKTTGICLRYNAQALQGKDTSAFEFLCTVFKDANVTLPTHV